MALQWQWKDKCGEAVFRQTINGVSKDFTVNLYEGNAYLIFVYEYERDGEKMYDLHGFFVDKVHMKRCLGLDKQWKDGNSYDKEYSKLIKIRFNKAKSRNYKEIIKALIEAFDDIDIELYTEKEEM